MTRRTRFALVLGLALALIVPVPASALVEDAGTTASSGPTFDTPRPTPRPTRRPRRTPRPAQTAEPTEEPAIAQGPALVPLVPGRTALTVGYTEPGALGQAPLLLALEQGYFADAGLDAVTLVLVADTLGDLAAGDLDIAVVPATAGFAASAGPVPLRAVSGFQNYQPGGDGYAGNVLMATEGLAMDEPATLIAFLSAYIRALQELGDADAAAAALEVLRSTDVVIDPAAAAAWPDAVATYAPFDGGFGDVTDEGGLGELAVYLGGDDADVSVLDGFVAAAPLNIAQAWLELSPNPGDSFVGAPALTEISVGMPMADGAPSPIVVADDAGLFTAAGFDSVEVVDVEEPLPGLLSGQIDLAVIDAVDVADGVAQGLPLRAIAGHRNYAEDGSTYGGDVLVVSADMLDAEPATVAAFLIAYLGGLQELADSVNAAAFAPHDGGFGARDIGAGLGELDAYLQEQLGEPPDLSQLIDPDPVRFAQAWSGVPANPAAAAAAASQES